MIQHFTQAAFFTLIIALAATPSHAASFTFDGTITYHNDVVLVQFTLDEPVTDVKVWTDSYMDYDDNFIGENFDPITSLWFWDTTQGDWHLLGINDDNTSIDTDQTSYDSGFTIESLLTQDVVVSAKEYLPNDGSLPAGVYLFTVATYANHAKGPYYKNGFNYDDDTPIALEDWYQPGNDEDMGDYWRVNLEGVSNAVVLSTPEPVDLSTAVPEPTTLLLLGVGIAGLSAAGRKRRTQ